MSLTTPQAAHAALDLKLRPALHADAQAIGRIYSDTLPPGQDAHAADPQARAGGRLVVASRQLPLGDDAVLCWIDQHRRNGRPLWLATSGGEAIGWISLLGFSDRPNCGCTAEIGLYVTPACQGLGVGRLLLGYAMREAPRWGLDRLLAFIWHDNTASQGLFRSHGFSLWGSLPGAVWADARSRDMLIFGRALA